VARTGAEPSVAPAQFSPGRVGLAVAGAVALILAACFAALMAAHPAHPPVLGLDRAWLATITPTREHFLTTGAKIVSLAAGPEGGTVIVIAVAAFLWFARKRPVAAVFLAVTLAASSGASQLIKHLVLRPRPAGALVPADIGSFPSGHVITSLAVGSALALVLARPGAARPRRMAFILVGVVTLLMMWCRTYLGAHWLSDTFESILVAAGLVMVGWAFAGPYIDREAERMAGPRDAPTERPR
jgi:membrane-associated phospholipid phosphatase